MGLARLALLGRLVLEEHGLTRRDVEPRLLRLRKERTLAKGELRVVEERGPSRRSTLALHVWALCGLEGLVVMVVVVSVAGSSGSGCDGGGGRGRSRRGGSIVGVVVVDDSSESVFVLVVGGGVDLDPNIRERALFSILIGSAFAIFQSLRSHALLLQWTREGPAEGGQSPPFLLSTTLPYWY